MSMQKNEVGLFPPVLFEFENNSKWTREIFKNHRCKFSWSWIVSDF